MFTLRAPAARGFALVLFVAAAGVLAGCAPGGPPRGTVEGQVTFKGKPVTEGMITFLGDKGHAGEAKLGPDGRYAITDGGGLPVGDYVVTISPLMYEDKSDPKNPPRTMVEKNAPDIPEKYRRQGGSPFKKTVKAGKNDINLDMVP